MNAFAFTATALVAAVLVEAFLPDRAIYRTGWYNVMLLALVVAVAIYARKSAADLRSASARVAVVAIAAGAGILGFTGMVNGLMAPDPQTVIGAPAEIQTLGEQNASIWFPPLGAVSPPELRRPGHAPLTIARSRYVGSFVLRPLERTVVRVEARNRDGAHLTVTQPTGTSFLSPVLLMESSQNISGLSLPYDSFALPAAHRIVKVVLFSAQQIAAMRGVGGPPSPAVLFAVDDAADQPIPHAIRLAHANQTIFDGGVWLRAQIVQYPAVEIIAAPSLPALIIACAIIAAGIALMLFASRIPLRS
jgi:hypothetical protein